MHSIFRINKDYYGGGLLVVIGLSAGFGGYHYHVGTLERMGPGFFPTAVGILLAVLGVVIALGARRVTDDRSGERPDWRGWTCIVGGIAAFVILGEYGGLVPATFAIVFISAFGDRTNTLKEAFWLASGMAVISVIVFWWGLQIQLPLFTFG